MNDACIKLIAQMIIATMAGEKEKTWQLYEKYIRERYLHVSVREILEAKETTA